MSAPFGRVLGVTFDGVPIHEPDTTSSSLTFAAIGGGKTTCVAVPAIQAMLADRDRAIFVNDVKNGEIAAQIAPLCAKLGRKFGIVDDFAVLGADNPYRISLNPFSSIVAANEQRSEDLGFLVENMAHTLIAEPGGDEKNFYWREAPREKAGLGARALLSHETAPNTPGALQALLADPMLWRQTREIAAEEADSVTRAMARQSLEMQETNKEHYAQHMRAALSALKIYADGPLHRAGQTPDLTHEELIRDHWVVCFVNPIRHVDRLGAYYAQHMTALMDAQLSGALGRADYVLDEYCNAPLKIALRRLTVFRAFGARAHFIAQSRQDSVRQYGEKETAILEENCRVKQWLSFSNFEEAERVSRAMGEQTVLTTGIGMSSDKLDWSMNIGLGKERILTADQLMCLPPDEQIIHIAGLGFIHCRKVRQNQIAPTCHWLGDNPLEGARLPPDPIVTLPTEMRP